MMKRLPIYGLGFLVIFIFVQNAAAQTKFRLGLQAGAVISKTLGSDTLANQFSRRNRLGGTAGIQGIYDLRRGFSMTFGVNFVNKGYKINNDTLRSSASAVRKMNSINIPIGLCFKQKFNTSNYIFEKFGVIGNYSFGSDSNTVFNNKSNPTFRITELRQNKIYPMFYLGIGLGGSAENGDRYEFAIIYNQSFSNDAVSKVEYGQNFSKSFAQRYRGGFLQINFTYYFDLSNFRKSDEYFE